MTKNKTNKWIIAAIVALVVIQFIPIDRTNPPVVFEPEWDSPQTKEYFRRACMDCHSNTTVWPWYSYIAPIKFIIAYEVHEGREYLNVSEGISDHAHDSAREVKRGDMPVRLYALIHKQARLTPEEKEEFIKGLEATFGTSKNPNKYDNLYNHPGGD